jgi:L-seryl-tRNA(Ser) seleniumtransferase
MTILKEEVELKALTDKKLFLEQVIKRIQAKMVPSLRRVINATGTVLHTNLGRSPLSKEVMERVVEASCSYSTLEYNLKAGKRGSRHEHVENLICKITGAEAAMVVNNNAAATMLVLSAMANKGEVIVSRGELVEIGGSFRIPDIMTLSGASLKEVGTTNKTHFSDYEQAIDSEKTAAIMKVHTSNYRVIGFTEDVGVKELKKLGKKYSLPVIYDMGNGLFADLKEYKIYEPTIADAMQAGADIMLFSGDKLLGGPQAGIIVGKKEYIERMKKHPLARVVRIDKMTLAALEAVFFEYQDVEKAKKTIPTLQMITASKEQLLEKAKLLQQKIALPVEIEPCEDFIGGGSAPDVRLEGYAVTIHSKTLSVEQIERKLRQNEIPIIAHRSQDKIWLHLRTLLEDDLEVVAKSIQTILRKDC